MSVWEPAMRKGLPSGRGGHAPGQDPAVEPSLCRIRNSCEYSAAGRRGTPGPSSGPGRGPRDGGETRLPEVVGDLVFRVSEHELSSAGRSNRVGLEVPVPEAVVRPADRQPNCSRLLRSWWRTRSAAPGPGRSREERQQADDEREENAEGPMARRSLARDRSIRSGAGPAPPRSARQQDRAPQVLRGSDVGSFLICSRARRKPRRRRVSMVGAISVTCSEPALERDG